MIVKYKKIPIGKNKGRNGYCIKSHTTGKLLSCYLTKKEAQKALRRYARFRKS